MHLDLAAEGYNVVQVADQGAMHADELHIVPYASLVLIPAALAVSQSGPRQTTK